MIVMNNNEDRRRLVPLCTQVSSERRMPTIRACKKKEAGNPKTSVSTDVVSAPGRDNGKKVLDNQTAAGSQSTCKSSSRLFRVLAGVTLLPSGCASAGIDEPVGDLGNVSSSVSQSFTESRHTWLMVSPHLRISSIFSSSVGYGDSRWSANHFLRIAVASLGRLPRRFLFREFWSNADWNV